MKKRQRVISIDRLGCLLCGFASSIYKRLIMKHPFSFILVVESISLIKNECLILKIKDITKIIPYDVIFFYEKKRKSIFKFQIFVHATDGDGRQLIKYTGV